MRLAWISIALTCIACATGPGSPPDSISGSWSSAGPHQTPTPAGPEIMTLTDSATVVTGSDSWAGQQRTVSGSYVRPAILLLLVTQPEMPGARPLLYSGKALDGNRIQLNGTIFYRQ